MDRGAPRLDGRGRAAPAEAPRDVAAAQHLSKPETVWFDWIRLPPVPEAFRGVLPKHWIVERTCSWSGQSPRLARDYVSLCETGEALIDATMTRLMTRRLARA